MEENVMAPLSKVLNTHQQSVLFYAIKVIAINCALRITFYLRLDWQEFIQIHQQMEHELKTAAGPDKKDTKVYIVFLNWKEKLNIYQKYGANLPAALDLVAKEAKEVISGSFISVRNLKRSAYFILMVFLDLADWNQHKGTI